MKLIDGDLIHGQIADNWAGMGVAAVEDILEFVRKAESIDPIGLKKHTEWIENLKYYLDTNEENGVVYIPKFVIEKIIKQWCSLEDEIKY